MWRLARRTAWAGLWLVGCFLWGSGQARAGDDFQLHANLVYARHADQDLLADVYVPQGEGPFPGVLVVHGGAWMIGNKSHMIWISEQLARSGYTAVTINYRLAPQFQFPAQIEDCKAAVRWLKSNAARYKIDAAHIAGFGYSAGGHLACLLGTTDASAGLEGADALAAGPDSRLQCIVAGGAPCDFRPLPAENRRLAYWLGGSRAEKPEAYERASPACFVSKDDPPTFFYHGENDSLVPLLSPKAMMAQLQGVGVTTALHTVPKAGHVQAFRDADACTEAIKFLDAHLKPAAAGK